MSIQPIKRGLNIPRADPESPLSSETDVVQIIVHFINESVKERLRMNAIVFKATVTYLLETQDRKFQRH